MEDELPERLDRLQSDTSCSLNKQKNGLSAGASALFFCKSRKRLICSENPKQK